MVTNRVGEECSEVCGAKPAHTVQPPHLHSASWRAATVADGVGELQRAATRSHGRVGRARGRLSIVPQHAWMVRHACMDGAACMHGWCDLHALMVRPACIDGAACMHGW